MANLNCLTCIPKASSHDIVHRVYCKIHLHSLRSVVNVTPLYENKSSSEGNPSPRSSQRLFDFERVGEDRERNC